MNRPYAFPALQIQTPMIVLCVVHGFYYCSWFLLPNLTWVSECVLSLCKLEVGGNAKPEVSIPNSHSVFLYTSQLLFMILT